LLEEDFSGGVMPDNWTTDFWRIWGTNEANGTAPEARIERFWQSGGGQYYDNHITTEKFDCTGWEKILMNFKFNADLYQGQYCYMYVQYRPNETTPWKDVSPWTNPMGSDQYGVFTIDCYGFGTDLGTDFQIRWQYIGYYYYYYDFSLDDITVEGCGGCAEYAELTPGITLQPGEERNVVFPGWTPSEWHNESYQDSWEKYPIQAFIVCEGDQRPRNDNQWILLDLYYPWFYDIEVSSIDEPSEEGRSIPGRVFDTQATIKNVGQFPLCCIGIDIEIGYPVTFAHPLSETQWDTSGAPGYYLYYPGYASGWRDEHKDWLPYYYGFRYTNNNRAGGDRPECYLYYYYARQDNKLKSPVFDTTGSEFLTFSFKTFMWHRYNAHLYAFEAGYSHDGGATWNTAWHYEPEQNTQLEVEVAIPGGSANTMVGFWFKGSNYYFYYWHIDDVDVIHKGIQQEYTDFMCQGDDLEAGEERVFEFDQWTPWDLADPPATTQSKEYFAIAQISPEGDMDAGNDLLLSEFVLDFWHDPALTGAGAQFLWNNGEPDGVNGFAGSWYLGYSNMIIDDFENQYPWTMNGGHAYYSWLGNLGTGNTAAIDIWFFEDEDDCDPATEDYINFTATSWTEELTGDNFFGYDVMKVTFEFPEFTLPAGRWFVGFQPRGVMDSLAYIWTTTPKDCELQWEGEYWGVSKWRKSSQQWGVQCDASYALFGEAKGPPGVNQFIQPGTSPVLFEAVNLGTFQELGLTAYATIKSYVDDFENGTVVYEDEIYPANLFTPLGGTLALNFAPFTYAYEGRYGVYVSMPGLPGRDDYGMNNAVTWGIGIDNTRPITLHTLSPETPDGDNDWYVSDLQVTLKATDPLVEHVSSGVAQIEYRVAGGSVETIYGGQGSFTIGQEYDSGSVLVEYWATDNVGNVEATKSFTIKMDQTPAVVDLVYEVESGNPIQGWILNFTATASDITSGMSRVEFYLNDGLQATEVGPGPTYNWKFRYYGDLSIDVRADAIDMAGNVASDIIVDPKPAEYQNSQTQQQIVKILQQG
jgi:hypothetical protein